MAVVKQRTVSSGNRSQTVVLKQLKAPKGMKASYEYVIEDKDTGSRFGDPFYRKRDAKREFERVVEDINQGITNQDVGFQLF